MPDQRSETKRWERENESGAKTKPEQRREEPRRPDACGLTGHAGADLSLQVAHREDKVRREKFFIAEKIIDHMENMENLLS